MRLEILFPHSRVSGLKNLHDEDWKSLVERIAALPETHPDALAFSYMMIKLCNCLNCDPSIDEGIQKGQERGPGLFKQHRCWRADGCLGRVDILSLSQETPAKSLMLSLWR
jgi:hypothetical protein